MEFFRVLLQIVLQGFVDCAGQLQVGWSGHVYNQHHSCLAYNLDSLSLQASSIAITDGMLPALCGTAVVQPSLFIHAMLHWYTCLHTFVQLL
jgi:hypothetical protein